MADAAPIVYHDSEFVSESDAGYAIQDRGLLFGDGVYEVVRYDGGQPFALDAHVDRMQRSLAGIGLEGVEAAAFPELSAQLLERNGLEDAKVYWQATRGPATRDFVMPVPDPSVTLIAYPTPRADPGAELRHGAGYLADDCRWTKCWIKSLMLLPASMAKTAAVRAGAVEAIFVRDKPGAAGRHVTEGSSTNVFAVVDGVLRTHPDDGWILGGVTRQTLLRLARELGIAVDPAGAFTPDELGAAAEVFVCSTTQITAITALRDGAGSEKKIADGRPGLVTQRLHRAYLEAVLDGGG